MHRDPYKKKTEDLLQFARQLAAADNIDQGIDWKKAADVTSRNEGIANEIGVMGK